MPDTINPKTTADNKEQSPSNHYENQDTNTIRRETNTKESNEDTLYDNMIFPS